MVGWKPPHLVPGFHRQRLITRRPDITQKKDANHFICFALFTLQWINPLSFLPGPCRPRVIHLEPFNWNTVRALPMSSMKRSWHRQHWGLDWLSHPGYHPANHHGTREGDSKNCSFGFVWTWTTPFYFMFSCFLNDCHSQSHHIYFVWVLICLIRHFGNQRHCWAKPWIAFDAGFSFPSIQWILNWGRIATTTTCFSLATATTCCLWLAPDYNRVCACVSSMLLARKSALTPCGV